MWDWLRVGSYEDQLEQIKIDDAALRQKLTAEVSRETKWMLSKTCPINNGLKCAKACIHFSKGRVAGDLGYPIAKKPSCRLWSR